MSRIKEIFEEIWNILKIAKNNFNQDEPIVYSASIAFFTIFSLPAILIVVTLLGSAFFSEEEVRSEIVDKVESLINVEASQQIDVVLQNAVKIPDGFWWILLGILVIVKSATMIFFIMQKALNSVWKVKVKPKVNYLQFLKHRLITLAMVFGLGVLLIISLMLDTIIILFSSELMSLFEDNFPYLIRLVNYSFALIVVLIVFVSIQKVLPDAKISWKDALPGGIITSILFIIGKQIINMVLDNVKVIGIYAAAGSLVVVLLWVFYSSIILFLGAEITKAYADYHGRKIEPSPIGVKYKQVQEIEH